MAVSWLSGASGWPDRCRLRRAARCGGAAGGRAILDARRCRRAPRRHPRDPRRRVAGRASPLLAALFEAATMEEQAFLFGLMLGEVRQGALEGVMVEAVARAAGLPVARRAPRGHACRRACPRSPAAMTEGGAGLVAVSAGAASDRCSRCWPRRRRTSATALARFGRAGFEYKLDGARMQVHKAGGDGRASTRANLNEVTAAVPESWSSGPRWSARRASSSTARRWRCEPTAGRSRSR